MRSIHILLVEDNSGDIFLIKEAFENTEVTNQISIVKNGQEAIDFLKKEDIYSNVSTPDFLLLDVNLPKKNGFEVLEFIRANDNLNHIPVIMLSTSSSAEDILKSYKKQANCFIVKPVNVEKLFEIISEIQKFWITVAKLPSTK